MRAITLFGPRQEAKRRYDRARYARVAVHKRAVTKAWWKNGGSVIEQCRRYGLTLDEYADMDDTADFVCTICRRPPTFKYLSVDHNHQTGKIRGLLCSPCNSGIGLLGDDPARTQAATEYLRARH